MARTQNPKTKAGSRSHWQKAVLASLTSLVFVGAMVAGIMVLHDRAGANKALPPNPAVVVNAKRVQLLKSYSIKERFVGMFEASRTTRLSFERQGRVTKVHFDEGEPVSKGQIVAMLDVSRLKVQRLGLRARLRELEAQSGLAVATLARQTTLNKKGWQSQQKLDEARFKSAQLSASIERVKASVESINIEIAKSALKAPYSGVVASRSIDEGSVVNPGSPVIDIVEAGLRRARVGVSVQAANSLRIDRSYRLVSNGRQFKGRLFSKRPDLETGTRTVTALFEVGDAAKLPIGEIVELVIDRQIRIEGAWLPISALSEGAKGLWTVLSVVQKEQKTIVVRRAVEVLHVEDGRAFVRGNFTPVSQIVIDGTNRINPGQKVALAARPK